MAKTNGKIRLIGLIVTLVLLVAGVAGTWAVYGRDIEANTEAIDKLDKEGCELANKHKIDIALIGEKMRVIIEKSAEAKGERKEFKVEQRKMRDAMNNGFKEILRRLPE